MKVLLDTHLLVWAATDDRALSRDARATIEDEENALYFSAASIWELTIKGPGRLGIPSGILHRHLLANGYFELPITADHALAVGTLPNIHRDPFDRVLLAQARVEGMTLITADTTLASYGWPAVLV